MYSDSEFYRETYRDLKSVRLPPRLTLRPEGPVLTVRLMRFFEEREFILKALQRPVNALPKAP